MAALDFPAPFTLVQLACFMDGGSVWLSLLDANSAPFSVKFTQTMHLQQHSLGNTPGSLLLNEREVAIRSATEALILAGLKQLNLDSLTVLERKLLLERIAFVESEEYLRIAALMGRI